MGEKKVAESHEIELRRFWKDRKEKYGMELNMSRLPF